MLAVQEFLRSGGTLRSLEEQFSIKSVRHSLYNNLILLKYNQIESDFSKEIVCDCRGLILNESDNWNIISFPFRKFFNYQEGFAADIDWNTARVMEKCDGSLAVMYNYDDKWHVSTSGTPDATGQVNDFGFSFAELFWKAFKEYDLVFPKDKNICFMFELTSQYNKIVVRHTELGLTLLGARDLVSKKEMTAKEAYKYMQSSDHEKRSESRSVFKILTIVKEYSLNNLDAVLKSLPDIDPLSSEGYVICDADYNRIKIKSPAYIALHHMKDGLASMRALVQVALNGEIDEVVTAFPEYLTELTNIKAKIFDLVVELENSYDKIKDIPIQKDFAMEAVKTRCSAALFALRAGKTKSIRSYLCNSNIDNVVNLLGLK